MDAIITQDIDVKILQYAIKQATSNGQNVNIVNIGPIYISNGPEGEDNGFHELTWREAKNQFKRTFIEAVLKAAGGNVSEAARRLKIQRCHLSRFLSQNNK